MLLRCVGLVGGLLLLVGLLVGCGAGGTVVDSGALVVAFGGASADLQEQVDGVVSALEGGDFLGVVGLLDGLVGERLTDGEREALNGFLADLQRVVAESPDDFGDEVDVIYRGLSDLVGKLNGYGGGAMRR